MASILKVDKLDPQSGTALEIGTSGDTVTVPTGAGLTVTDEVKTNKISPATGTAFALGDSGDTFTVPSGATIVNSGTATGFGGGKIGQAVTATRADDTSITSTSFTDTNCSVAITPTATSSKVLLMMSVPVWIYRGGYVDVRFKGQIVRSISGGASTNLVVGGGGSLGVYKPTDSNDDNWGTWLNFCLLDSPVTSAETTFKLQLAINNATGTSYVVANVNDTTSYMTALEVLA
jgi:hypothetical protein